MDSRWTNAHFCAQSDPNSDVKGGTHGDFFIRSDVSLFLTAHVAKYCFGQLDYLLKTFLSSFALLYIYSSRFKTQFYHSFVMPLDVFKETAGQFGDVFSVTVNIYLKGSRDITGRLQN